MASAGGAAAAVTTQPTISSSAAANANATTTIASASTAVSTTNVSTASSTTVGALEIESLVKHNISTRRELEAWILEQKNSLLLEKTTHEQQIQDRARQSQEAQRKRESLQQQQKTLAASVHEKENEINAHQVEIEVLQAEKSKKEPVLKELFLRNQEEDQKLKYLVNESTEVQTTQERQLAELQQGLAMYQRLGLFFEHTGGEFVISATTTPNQIIVRFTQIDPAEPNRVFSFRIRIDPVTDRFLVDECNEDVSSFDGLVEDLNDSGDLSFFIRSMRRQFKQLVV